VLILSRGRAIAEDRPETLERKLRGGALVKVVVRGGPADLVRRLEELAFVRAVEAGEVAGDHPAGRVLHVELDGPESTAALSAAITGMGAGLLELSPQRLGLEEVFLRLVREEKDPR